MNKTNNSNQSSASQSLPLEGKVRKGPFLPLKGAGGSSSRGGSLWLFLELVVITIVPWVVVDPTVVNLYYLHLPKGYDSERLVHAEIRNLIHSEPVVGDTPIGSELAPWLTERLKETEGVENAYCYGLPYNIPSWRYSTQVPICREHDTIYVACTRFEEGRHFFETFGLRPLPGSPKAEELSEQKEAEKGAVLSESAAKYVFGTSEGIVGRRFTVLNTSNNEPEHWTVAGVVADAQHQRYSSLHSMIYFPNYSGTTPSFIMIRLRKGVKPQKFVDEHAADIMSTVQTPFYRIKKMEPYEELLHREDLQRGLPQKTNISLALALFFLANLSLAVIGTVWLQARRRTEECGVRRAFGATRLRLLMSFLSWGALLATACVLIGCFIYFQYAYSGYEVYDGWESFKMYTQQINIPPLSDQTWVDHFWPHFLIVSAVVYIIILCTVLIGTTIPALKILGTKITDALREE